MPSRTFFIPFESRKQCDFAKVKDAIEKSGKVLSLNGLWDFAFYEKGNIPATLNTDKLKYEKIKVPSCWQLQGYGKPYYIKDRYPFNCKPPTVPTKKPVGLYYDGKTKKTVKAFNEYNYAGVYRKHLEIEDRDKNFIISFLGVSSCFELYLNGEFIGYSEGSNNTAEFDLTNKIWMGKNEIVVIVHRWCNGSYLESHDKFTMNGIFRDVLLFVNEKSYIQNLFYETHHIEGDKFRFESLIDVRNFEDLTLKIVLQDDRGVKYQKEIELKTQKTLVSFDDTFEKYNAEKPHLYRFYVSLIKNNKEIECVCKKVGFRYVKIENQRLLYNGKPILIKGINYLESHPQYGISLPFEQYEKDIKLIKEYNINTVQFVYPAHPIMLQLCDEAGLYVISHADVNTSGTNYSPFHRVNLISDNKKWKEVIEDRIKRMVLSQKSNVSITIWSMSSQMGDGYCQQASYDYLKEITSLPVQYDFQQGKGNAKCDLYAIKDAPIDEVSSFVEKADKPVILSQFNNAIGASGGGLKEYMELFINEKKIVGGCVWQFCDNTLTSSKYKDIYGGMNNEHIHDLTQCASGYFSSRREPYTAARSLKFFYRPLIARLVDTNTLEIMNTNSYMNSNYIDIQCSVLEDGKKRSRFNLQTSIEPFEKREYDVFLGHTDGDIFLNIDYYDKNKDRLITTEQLTVNVQTQDIKLKNEGKMAIVDSKDKLCIKYESGDISFDKKRGCILNYTYKGLEYLVTNPLRKNIGNLYTNILRPFTDSDLYSGKARNYIINVVKKDFSYKATKDNNKNITKIEVAISTVLHIGDKEAFLNKDLYVIYPNARVDIYTCLQQLKDLSFDLKRVGKTIKMPQTFQNVIYYGRGPGENYADIKDHCPVGIYSDKAPDFMIMHPKPQLSGNRCDTRYALVFNDEGNGLMFLALNRPMNFSAETYSVSAINNAKHPEDLSLSNSIYVNISGELEGIGNFGKGVMDKYKVPKEKVYGFGFSMLPYNK